VAAMLDEFEKAKMLFRWVVDGKTYGFFIGSQKVHRLPYPSDRMKYAAPWNTGMLPEVELAQYLGFSVERVREEYGDLLSTYSRLTLDLLSTKSSTGNGNGSGVGVESGVGNGYEKGNENGNGNGAGAATLPSLVDSTLSSPISQNSTIQQNSKTPQPLDYTAKGFAQLFHTLMNRNPSSKSASIPKNWETLWTKDFRELISASNRHSPVSDIIAMSQTEKNKQYYIRPMKLVENLSLLEDMLKEKSKILPQIRSSLLKAISDEEAKVDIEDIGDDELA
jgi:hypothetical protein